MKRLTLSTTLMGHVTDIKEEEGVFSLKCRSGDEFQVSVGKETRFVFVQNLDDINPDRVPTPEGFNASEPSQLVKKYIQLNIHVVLQGVYQDDNGKQRFDARLVNLLHSSDRKYVFEGSRWWLMQISRLADRWLEDLFGTKQSYVIDDFALYQTNLNIVGLPFDNNIQECATLSRLIYGLSSSYLLTGCERYFLAARAGVDYQRQNFRILSHDGTYCVWAFGKRKDKYGSQLFVRSLNGDDLETIPLYEQIYALAGLAQYYRISLDWEVLDDIKRTVRGFNQFFLDRESEYGDHAYGDYFSHLDYVTMSCDSEALGNNQSRKNWNSLGDHIPAYLINLILALEPLPITDHGNEDLSEFLKLCKKLLETSATIIVEKFPDPDPTVPYVNERFFRDWKPDHNWGWQQNRAVVGHNLKIAWNLTRVANYYYCVAKKVSAEDEKEAKRSTELADKLMTLANKLGVDMAEYGVDQVRGGIFDTVERSPKNGMRLEFPWSNTKDFWQQEQCILAYLILHGCTSEDDSQKQEYLKLARETEAFWNLFFVDPDNNGIFFRVNDSGMPVIQGNYGNKAAHAIAGYHAFELNYLAHIYISAYVTKQPFCLYFKPNANCRQRSLNVLPDFFKPNTLEVKSIRIDGSNKAAVDPDYFQIELGELAFQLGSQAEIIVEFNPL